MDIVKWGMIGCGNVTEIKSGPAFQLINNSKLVAVMCRGAEKSSHYAKTHNIPKWYTSADELIDDKEVNAVYIATPPSSHAELAIKALKSRKPVYVEKPMALNYDQCQEMIKYSEQYQTPLFVAYYRRALPGFLKIKSLIESGSIGKVLLVNISLFKSPTKDELERNLPWRVIPEIAGGGHFIDLASHQLDYLDFLFGPVQKTNSFALNQMGKYQAEDIVTANFLMPNSILVNGTWCFTVPLNLEKDTIEIIGEKGKIRFSFYEFVPIELITDEGTVSYENIRPPHVQFPLIERVVGELLGKDTSPSTAYSSARTSFVMDQVIKEYYKTQTNF